MENELTSEGKNMKKLMISLLAGAMSLAAFQAICRRTS